MASDREKEPEIRKQPESAAGKPADHSQHEKPHTGNDPAKGSGTPAGADDNEGMIDLFATPEVPGAAHTGQHLMGSPTTLRPAGPHTTIAAREPPDELPADDNSGVDLLALSKETKEIVVPELHSPDVRMQSDSGIDLVEEQLLVEGGSGALSDIDLVGEGKSDSGRDLIAEAVESGIDLPSGNMEIVEPAPTPSTDLEDIDVVKANSGETPSSVVNLGGPPERSSTPGGSSGSVASGVLFESSSMSGSSFDAAINLDDIPVSKETPSGINASEVDLGGQDSGPRSGTSSLRESGEVVSDSDDNFSGLVDSGRIASTINATPDSMVRVVNQPEPEPELSLRGRPGDEPGDDDAAETLAGEADEKPAKKPSAKRISANRIKEVVASGARNPWVGKGAIGVVGAVVGAVAVSLFGGGGGTKSSDVPRPMPAVGAPGVQPAANPQVAMGAQAGPSALDMLRGGDFERAGPALEHVDESKQEMLAARGENRWLSYLKKQFGSGGRLNKEDASVKQAAADLGRASTADAAFWLGHLQEATGNLNAARETYSKASFKFPEQKRRFQAALDRLDLRAAGSAAPGERSQAEPWTAEQALVAALLFTNLQAAQPKADEKAKPAAQPGDGRANAGQPAPAANETEEAGYDFWTAAKLAHGQHYAEALQTLDKARSIHEQRRFARLRKSQNPLSDPTEEIFLRACDGLKTAWEMQLRLQEGGYLAGNKTPAKALDELLAKAKEGGARGIAEKLVSAKVIEKPEDVAEGVDQLLRTYKQAQDVSDKLLKEKVVANSADLDKGVTELLAGRRAVQAVADALVRAGVIQQPANIAQGIAQLLAIHKVAEDAVDRLTKEGIPAKADELPKAVGALLAERKAADAKATEASTELAQSTAAQKQLRDDLAAAKQRSRTLEGYIDSIRAQLPKEQAQGALDIVRSQPRAVRTKVATAADPVEAERHYAEGLRHYFARRYDAAEADFTAAIEQDNQDARYYYYLGLAHLAQQKRIAYDDFEQGARLEKQERPGRVVVSRSLERVQGNLRQTVNQVRDTIAGSTP